jgi:carboxylate-amine ligase
VITFGVEEEYLLVDPTTGEPVPAAAEVRRIASLHSAVPIDSELLLAQVEIATPVCSTLAEARDHVTALRRTVSAAAVEAGCRVAATASAPVGRGSADVTPGERYRAIVDSAPQLAFEMLINGLHVHAAVPDRAVGVRVANRLRPWLAILLALSANSPFWNGRDTGFASWRSIQFERWPVSGPPPLFADIAEYDARADELLTSGVILDVHQMYYLARISDRWPTVEVRPCDVPPTVDESVLLAGLVRALVETALAEDLAGRAVPQMHHELVRASTWKAARHGMTGDLLHPLTRRLASAADVAHALVEHVTPALRGSGDAGEIERLLTETLARGTGAERQRAVCASGGMAAVTPFLVAETVRGL